MEATMLDLRRNTKRVLKAIDDREHVTLTHRGKKKAVSYMELLKVPATKMISA